MKLQRYLKIIRKKIFFTLLWTVCVCVGMLIFFNKTTNFRGKQSLINDDSEFMKDDSEFVKDDSDFSYKLNGIKDDGEFIILWYGAPDYIRSYINQSVSSTCSVQNCNISISRQEDDFNKSDVVIFSHEIIPDVQPHKVIGQRWIFFTLENPYFTLTKGIAWKNKFDWLMSYRRDSHIFHPYSIIRKRKIPYSRNYTKTFMDKRKDAVWMSGHCPVPSNRSVLVKQLSEFMKVDMFGPCGTEPCGNMTPHISDCLKMVSRNYKFYFSFENAICTDYSTEKVFNLYSYSLEIIPVIIGPLSAKEYLPTGTYINALEYESIEELAKALNKIGSDEQKYVNYLREKDKYFDIGEMKITESAMCDICQKLNTKGPTYKIKNIADYWSEKDCMKPPF